MATVLIVLEVEGSQADAFDVVDAVLDEGVLQESIRDYADANTGALRVTSAVAMAEKDFVPSVPDEEVYQPGEEHREITQADVGRSLFSAFGRHWQVADFIGRIMKHDVGKRVFLRGGVLQVENDAQRAARLAGTEGTP